MRHRRDSRRFEKNGLAAKLSERILKGLIFDEGDRDSPQVIIVILFGELEVMVVIFCPGKNSTDKGTCSGELEVLYLCLT